MHPRRDVWRSACLLAACATICATRPALAVDPARATSQYIRDSWSVEQGYPGGVVSSIAQTPDGYLWLGTERGLVQFDGVTFRLRADSKPASSSAVGVVGLAVDTDGALWVTRHGPDPQRYAHGRFENALWSLRPREDAITAICRGKHGDVLLAGIVNGVRRFTKGSFETVAGANAVPHWPVSAIAETTDGKVWLATKDSGLFSVDGGRVTAVTKGLPSQTVTVLLPVSGASMWIGTDRGAVLWNGTEVTPGGLPPALSRTRILTMLSDGESNLWIGTDEGLLRVNAKGVERLDDREDRSKAAVTALFEDREGNLWVGRAGRLERLREGSFTSYGQTEGMPSDRPGPLHVDDAGRMWFGPAEGGLHWLDNGNIGRVTDADLSTDVVYSISGGGNEVWVGRKRGGLTRVRRSGSGFETATFTKRDGLADDSVFTVYRTEDGDVWAGTLSAGVSRWSRGALTSYTVAQGLASNVLASILQTSDGTMWFATPQGLSALSNGRWHTYRTADGLPSDSVNCLLEDSAGVLWIGSAGGLAAFGSGRMQNVDQMSSALRDQIIGLAEDTAGSLWIATSSAVLHVNADKLRRGVVTDSDIRVYDVQDGLRSVEAMRRDRSLVRDTKGRIWMSTTRGFSVVDPARLAARSSPALARVETMSVDGSAMDLSSAMRLPPGHERITFEFVGLSLSAPQRVRFRYRLDGVDRDWSAPSAAREAIYRDVGPGSYTFRVMAASDGSWTESGAPVAFTVDPAFWQTMRFRLSSVLALVLAAIAVYHIRMRQLTRQLTVRFEERLAERTRIAQELHDTLLQGLLSASMQLHTAVDDLPAESPTKPTFNKVLALIGRVIDEGRNAVRGLRSSSTDDLEHAFVRVQQEYAVRSQADFHVIIEGHVRALRPLIRDEVYRIGREALVNAFRHSGARRIELELDYGPTHLRMLVRDNGCGVDAEIVQSGRDGHWGLPGMRERAQRIGGRLTLRSRNTAGTEVEFSLPAHAAFEQPRIASRS